MRALWIVVVLGTAFGCDGGSPVEPVSGTWGYAEGDLFDDTCRYGDPPTNPMGTFRLTNNGDGTMTITPGSDPPFSCTLSGAAFTCPDRSNSDIPISGLDANIRIHVAAFGSFSSPQAASGHQEVGATCTGTQCDLAAGIAGVTFPCGFSVRFTATFVMR